MVIWHREVLYPIEEQNVLSNNFIKLFKKYMIMEINKTFEINKINSKNKINDSPIKEHSKEEIEVNISFEGFNSNSNLITETVILDQKTLTCNFFDTITSKLSLYSTQNSFSQPSSFTTQPSSFSTQPTSCSKDKSSVNEEFSNIGYHIEYFMEQYFIF